MIHIEATNNPGIIEIAAGPQQHTIQHLEGKFPF